MSDLVAASSVRLDILRAPWTASAKALAIRIYDLQGLASGWCTKGRAGLAKDLAMPPDSVKRALAELSPALEVQQVKQGQRARRRLVPERIPCPHSGDGSPVTRVAHDPGDGSPVTRGMGRPRPGGRVAHDPGIQEDQREDLLEDLSEAGARNSAPPALPADIIRSLIEAEAHWPDADLDEVRQQHGPVDRDWLQTLQAMREGGIPEAAVVTAARRLAAKPGGSIRKPAAWLLTVARREAEALGEAGQLMTAAQRLRSHEAIPSADEWERIGAEVEAQKAAARGAP